MALSDLPRELAERGIWWQVAGFSVLSTVSMVVLVELAGSEARAYRYFETAVKTMYWANVFVLVGLFEGVRRMFEKASELRARYREQALNKAIERERKRYNARWEEAYARFGMEVDGVRVLPHTPEVRRFLNGADG